MNIMVDSRADNKTMVDFTNALVRLDIFCSSRDSKNNMSKREQYMPVYA
jgi:hypothetical protein